MDLLISLDGATNPLWLSLSCEELRVFGVFERVTDHIKSLPDSLQGLLNFILKRIVAEDEFQNVEKVSVYSSHLKPTLFRSLVGVPYQLLLYLNCLS